MTEGNTARGIQYVAETVSNRVAIRLIEAFPGICIYVPKKLSKNHKLLAIGEAEAAQLVAALGGAEIAVPMSGTTSSQRQALILELDKAKMPRPDIALRAECSERWVYCVLADHRQDQDRDERQGSLL